MKLKVIHYLSIVALGALILGLSIFLVLNSKFVFYLDYDLLKLKESGFDAQTARHNYNILIDYLSPFSFKPLVFDGLDSSPTGLKHFKEVKDLLNAFYLVGLSGGIVYAFLRFFYGKDLKKVPVKSRYSHLKKVKYFYISIISILVIFFIVDFDTTFVTFHKIFFNNDDWLFNPFEDEIINLLPEMFFMHMAILIFVYVAFLLVGLEFSHKFLVKEKPDGSTDTKVSE
jgi:integral membrane protein (TIGR01906 family)